MSDTAARLRRDIDFHLERATDLERHANHWWRASKYAWLAAASVHRIAARELQSVCEEIALRNRRAGALKGWLEKADTAAAIDIDRAFTPENREFSTGYRAAIRWALSLIRTWS